MVKYLMIPFTVIGIMVVFLYFASPCLSPVENIAFKIVSGCVYGLGKEEAK